MLTLEESKKYLGKFNLTDKQVEIFRDAAYSIVNEILDEIYETNTEN
jgi:hypothetical protein